MNLGRDSRWPHSWISPDPAAADATAWKLFPMWDQIVAAVIGPRDAVHAIGEFQAAQTVRKMVKPRPFPDRNCSVFRVMLPFG